MNNPNTNYYKVATIILTIIVVGMGYFYYTHFYNDVKKCIYQPEANRSSQSEKYKEGNAWVDAPWRYEVEKRMGDFYRLRIIGAVESHELTGGMLWGNIAGSWTQSNFESVNCNSILKYKVPVELDDMFGICYTTNKEESPELFPDKRDHSPFMLIKVTDRYGNEVEKDTKGEARFYYKGINTLDFKYNNDRGEACFEALDINEIIPAESPYGNPIRNYFCTAMTRKLLTQLGKSDMIIEDLEDGRVVAKDFEGSANLEVSGYEISNIGMDSIDSINISKVNKVYK